MMGKTHLLFGAACYAAIPMAPLIGLPLAAYAALWPDFDQKQSTASQTLPPVGYMVRLWAGGHRRRTHLRGRRSQLSLVLVAAFVAAVAALYLWVPVVGWAVGIGYLSHLLGDQIPRTGGTLEDMLKPFLWLLLFAGLAVRVWYAL